MVFAKKNTCRVGWQNKSEFDNNPENYLFEEEEKIYALGQQENIQVG